MRLTTGEPARDFVRVVAALTHMVEVEHVALFASHLVIGEAYVALQHHYAVSKPDAKAALRSVLTSGLVAPSGGDAVLEALGSQRGCGLLDRLIVLQHSADGLSTLTLDRKNGDASQCDPFGDQAREPIGRCAARLAFVQPDVGGARQKARRIATRDLGERLHRLRRDDHS
ncbi:MAG: hypothetical protein IPG91_00360 [Ideonella sp.]|nr:hypothetical protein [Ideonella sp.]